ncbi:cyclohexanone monooxygenase [Trichoderma evansii]
MGSQGYATSHQDFDVFIIGAGLSGICALHHIRKRFPQWRVKVVEAASDVGGTWFWNCYPGARFDSESTSYSFSFDQSILDDWHWKESFSPQQETLKYINFVVDRLQLRRDIQLNTRIISAQWANGERKWHFTDESGNLYTTRFYVSCLGFLSNPTLPAIPGIKSFQGRHFHTSRWPKDLQTKQMFSGKRIGVFGTGATGIQTITALSNVPDIKSLTVFQRTANWSAPLRNSEISTEKMKELRKEYPRIFQQCAETPTCFMHAPDPRKSCDVTPEERRQLWESIYAKPGMAKWLGAFIDTYSDRTANKLYSDFMADKIRARVHDPQTAESLIPKDHGFGLRRVPLESGYFEAYNKPNVHLVDLKKNAVDTVTEKGIRLQDGTEHELDILVYATGFNAITGAFVGIDWRGKNGVPLLGNSDTKDGNRAIWVDYRPRTYLGLTVPKFPNMFMVLGPHQPFGNATRSIEHAVEVIVEMLSTCEDKGYTYVEPTEEAVDAWTEHVWECSEGALLNEVDSWMTGVNKNVAGKTQRNVARYAGSAIEFRRRCELSRQRGWEGLTFA